MAIADMFLKIQGATGEAVDADHKGEIEVISWSWGMKSSHSMVTGQAKGRVTVHELQVVKRVDQSSSTLMKFLYTNKPLNEVLLTVRKAGTTPLEYYTVELGGARITSVAIDTENAQLVERISLAFAKVKASYVPQDSSGAKGGGANVFEADLSASV